MGVEGIGASVVGKEDRRFITGKGRYVDDIKLDDRFQEGCHMGGIHLAFRAPI
jgi:CO/xanthine dehydrogenase Mo-binding subunit